MDSGSHAGKSNGNSPWTETFFPKSQEEFIGNSEIVAQAFRWADSWNEGKKQKPLLMWGQSGAGKTCLAILIAKLNNWDIFEMNASDLRSKDAIERLAGAAAMNSSFSGNRRLVLFDEVDGLQAQDRGGTAAIAQVLKESQNPIILTANDIYADQKLAQLRAVCTVLEFKKINYLSMAKRLREILSGLNIVFDEEAVKELAKGSEGDFRAALIDLQSLSSWGNITKENLASLGYRERREKVFSVMKEIFNGHKFGEIRNAVFSSDLSQDMLFNWVDENIPRQLSRDDAADAFSWLSKADVFNGRIRRRQHFGFMRYSSDLMSAGIAFSRNSRNSSFTPFQFPLLLSTLSRSRQHRQMKSGLGAKIGRQMHSSSREVISKDMPFLKIIADEGENAVLIAAQFDLNEDKRAFRRDTNPDTKKVQNVLSKAGELRSKLIAEKAFQRPFKMHETAIKEAPESDDAPAAPEENEPTRQTKLF